ncbi:hypothetical protein [Serinicoccus sp. CNJ-927]|uniref:hypothetical protein n=1 Tax=Serinicoccus sp. CNJ-927 TaxID=1904970 RepID=UPI001EDA501E|nr:hypothetical protein [Serinicoccus sp. CNJ-927]
MDEVLALVKPDLRAPRGQNVVATGRTQVNARLNPAEYTVFDQTLATAVEQAEEAYPGLGRVPVTVLVTAAIAVAARTVDTSGDDA